MCKIRMDLIVLTDVCAYFTKHINSTLGGVNVERLTLRD